MRLKEYRKKARKYRRKMLVAGVLTFLSVLLAVFCYVKELYVPAAMALFYVLCGVVVMMLEKKPKI